MRAPIFLSALLLCAAAGAQAPATTAPAQALTRDPVAQGQRVTRVRVEDAGSRVDEQRYGGETQIITVQPKTDLPEYQVKRDGARVWNVLKF